MATGSAPSSCARSSKHHSFETFRTIRVWRRGLEANTRYDCAHGFGHRDVIGRRAGLPYKQSFTGLTYEELFHHALCDFQENHAARIAYYLAH